MLHPRQVLVHNHGNQRTWYADGADTCAGCSQVTSVNVDIAKVAPTYHLYTQEEVQEVIGRL